MCDIQIVIETFKNDNSVRQKKLEIFLLLRRLQVWLPRHEVHFYRTPNLNNLLQIRDGTLTLQTLGFLIP